MARKVDDSTHEETEPVCRFGPGGDFVSVWPPPHSRLPQPSPNRLAKLLTWLSEILTTLLGLEPDTAAAVPTNIQPAAENILCRRAKLQYQAQSTKPDKPVPPTLAAVIKGDSFSPAQSMLFPDDCRTGHKSKHRIRTHRRTAKKRPALSFTSQDSLFETNLKSAKTA